MSGLPQLQSSPREAALLPTYLSPPNGATVAPSLSQANDIAGPPFNSVDSSIQLSTSVVFSSASSSSFSSALHKADGAPPLSALPTRTANEVEESGAIEEDRPGLEPLRLSFSTGGSHQAKGEMKGENTVTTSALEERQGADEKAPTEDNSIRARSSSREQSATLPSTTSAFWFNGHLMRAQSVLLRDDREKTWVASSNAASRVWIGLDHFRIPCQFTFAGGVAQSAERCPRSLFESFYADGDGLMERRLKDLLSATSSSVEQNIEDRKWISAVEDTVAAQISAEAHRKLFSWHGTPPSTSECNAAENPKLALHDDGNSRDALLQWWSAHH